MINNNRQGSIGPVIIAVASAAVIILFLLGWYPQTWFKNLFGGSDKLALIGSFGDFKDGGTIDDAAKTIVDDLISAQTNAKTENTKWGGCFRNPAGGSDFYDIVSNILVSPDDACTIGGSIIQKSNNNLPNGIEFLLPESGKFISVVFNVNGTTNSSRDIVLQISNGIEHRFIIITPLGFITYGLTSTVTTSVAPAPTPTTTLSTTTVVVNNRTVVIKPTAPTNVSAFSGNGAVTISWNPPVFNGNAPIIQYRVYRSLVSNGVRSVAGTTASNTLSFTDSGLLNGANYYYRVTAFNFLFESPESFEVVGTPNGPTVIVVPPPQQQCQNGYTGTYPNCYPPYQPVYVPSAPRYLSADGEQNEIDLSWSAPSSNGGSSISSYRIYRANNGGSPYYLATVDDSDRDYTDRNLPNGALYYYYVSAVNSAGEGNFSNQASATTNQQTTQQCQNGYTGTYPNCVQQTQAPHIVNHPQDQTVNEGQEVTFWVAISDANTPRTYQWKKNGVNIYGATSFSYTLTATAADNGALFSVVVSNSAGSDTSRGARLTVVPQQQQTSVPSAPLNLVATAGGNRVYLSWNAPSSNGGSSISSYRIYRSVGNGQQYFIFQTGATNYDDIDLAAGTTYGYQVSAVNSAGEGIKSNYASATTVPPVPQPNAIYNTGNSITFSWNTALGATSYTVRRGTSPNNPTTTFQVGNNTSFTDSNLSYNTTYYYAVAGVNSAGSSNYSVEMWTTTSNAPQTQQCPSGYTGTYPNCVPPQSSVPGAPTLSATGGQNQINLSWTAPHSGSSPITNYNIYRAKYSYSSPTWIANTGNASSSFADLGLSNGASYYYWVTAVNSAGDSAFSNRVYATANGSNNNPPANNAPSTPQNVSVYRNTSNPTINVSWNASSGATSYKVRRGTSPNSPNQTFTANSTTFADQNLNYNTTYYYSVAASNSNGDSNYSAPEVWATTINAPSNNNPPPQQTYAPSAPQNVGAYGNSSNPTVNVYWNASSGATSYKLLRATSPNSPSKTTLYVGNVTSYADQNLSYNTTYYYVVVATNSSGDSNYSTPEVWVTTMSAPSNNPPNNPPSQQTNAPATPSGLSIYHTGNSVTFSWYASSGATSYSVRRGTSPNSPAQTFTVTNNNFTDQNLNYDTTYYYSVAAVNSAGTSGYSTEAWTTTGLQ